MSNTVCRVEPRTDDPSRGYLVIPCELAQSGACRFSVWRHPARHPVWEWKGSAEKPTISPSVGCDNNCGRHMVIVDGIAQS